MSNGIDVISYDKGAQTLVKAVCLGDRILALIVRTSNAGKSSAMLVLISSKGELLSQSDPLPIAEPTDFGELAACGDDSALVAIINREGWVRNEQPTPSGFPIDNCHWFSCSCANRRIEVKPLGVWKKPINLSIRASVGHAKTAWLASIREQVLDPSNPPPAHLHYGFSAGPKPPDLINTTIVTPDYSLLPFADDQILTFVNTGFHRLTMFRFGRGQDNNPVQEVSAKSQQKGELSSGRIIACRDGHVFLWRYFNKKIKRETRDAGIFFRTCSQELNEWGNVTRLSADREIPVDKVRAFGLPDRSLVVWRNGLSKTNFQIRFIEFSSTRELPRPVRSFPAPLPQEVLQISGRRLALATEFCDKPYGWTLRAWPLPASFE